MNKIDFDLEDEDLVPNTPVVKDNSKRSKDDPNEILLGDDEVLEDDSDTMEEYYED